MRIYAVWITCGFSLFFLCRCPSALSILGFSINGIGPVLVFGNVHAGSFFVGVQILVVVILMARLLLKRKVSEFFNQFRQLGNFYTFCLAFMWLEILLVSCLSLNPYRVDALKNSFYSQWLPILIMLLSRPLQGNESWCRGIFWGLAAYAIAYVVPLLPVMYLDGRLQDAALGAGRLTTYSQDTINGCRMFFFGALGCFALAASTKKGIHWKYVWFGAAAFFFALMMLNGTRQFLLGLAVALAAYLWRSLAKNRIELLFFSLLLVGAFYSVRQYMSETAGVGRFEGAAISEEAESLGGRGEIWAEALLVALAHPISGAGFRNFGDELVWISEETGEMLSTRSGAHGFFQSVAADHGIMLAVALLAALITFLRNIFKQPGLAHQPKFAFVCIISAIAASDNFSCSDFNAFGYHMFALVPLVTGFRRGSIKIQSAEGGGSEKVNRIDSGRLDAAAPFIPGKLCL